MSEAHSMLLPAAELKRLRWRCRRGLRELDVLLNGYLERLLVSSAAPERHAFGRLLEESDMELYDWLTGRCRAPDDGYAALIERILNSARKPAP